MKVFRQAIVLAVFAACAGAQTAPAWSKKSPPASPSARSQHAMAYDSARGQLVLFGGFDDVNGLSLGDTWVWDGANWTRKTPQTAPTPRFGHNMVYDSAHGQIVMFGGEVLLQNGYADLNDTWTWDGANWSRQTPQTNPSARLYASMAYDAARGQVILFGGIAGNINSNCVVPLGDTWAWDGMNWTKKSPAAIPTARFESAMAYDSAHSQIVMFGGGVTQCNGQGAVLVNDTWIWDGVNWSQRSPQNNPAPRFLHAMSYDLAGGQTILFGGANSQPLFAAFGDTWAWDGSNWTQKSTSGPVARYAHAMAFDSAHSQTVLFGGLSGNALIPELSDTWTLNSASNGGSQPTVTTVMSAGGFGGFTAAAPGTWIEIFGSNLAPTTRTWTGADFTGVNAPTSLDGVQVTVGGQKAFIDYISPVQINAQLPSNIIPGPQSLTVTNVSASAPVTLTVNATQPGLLAPASFLVGGNQYVVAQALDGTYILPTGAIAGVNSRPARPDETIVIYGIGFGPVIPDSPAGQIVTRDNQLAAPLVIRFGSSVATTVYAGLALKYVGLYQFNVIVPAVPDNNLVPLTFTLGGAAGSQTLYTAVQQ